MNPVHFSSASDEWATPQDFFDELNAEFGFVLDVCANRGNAKCASFIPADSLQQDWATIAAALAPGPVWMNPPYGRGIGAWVAKAAATARAGVPVVALLPARTDTRWFHEHIWDAARHSPREGVEVRLIRGRLKFGGSKNSAPFPSAVVVFR